MGKNKNGKEKIWEENAMEKKGRNVKDRTKMKGKKMERNNGRTVRKKGKERKDKRDS